MERRTQKQFLNIIDVDFGLIWNYLNTSLVELALAVRLKKYKRFVTFLFFFILFPVPSPNGDQVPGAPSGDLGDKGRDYFHRIQMSFVMSMRLIIGDDQNDAPI